jgi:hypothetical protein
VGRLKGADLGFEREGEVEDIGAGLFERFH